MSRVHAAATVTAPPASSPGAAEPSGLHGSVPLKGGADQKLAAVRAEFTGAMDQLAHHLGDVFPSGSFRLELTVGATATRALGPALLPPATPLPLPPATLVFERKGGKLSVPSEQDIDLAAEQVQINSVVDVSIDGTDRGHKEDASQRLQLADDNMPQNARWALSMNQLSGGLIAAIASPDEAAPSVAPTPNLAFTAKLGSAQRTGDFVTLDLGGNKRLEVNVMLDSPPSLREQRAIIPLTRPEAFSLAQDLATRADGRASEALQALIDALSEFARLR